MRKKIQYLYNSQKIKHILFHHHNITTINANTNITNTIKATITNTISTTTNITNATPTIRIVS